MKMLVKIKKVTITPISTTNCMTTLRIFKFKNHLWVCENKPVCKKCGKKDFKSKQGYEGHINNRTCDKYFIIYQCELCDKPDGLTWDQYRAHKTKFHKKRICPDNCGYEDYITDELLRNHLSDCRNELTCNKCKYKKVKPTP